MELTREETKKILEEKRFEINTKVNSETIFSKALDFAIEALEQELCEDCISRQVVKELYYKDGYIDFRKICELRPVTLQPKIGRWAILKDEYGDITEAVCSCCDKNGNHKWAFCPNCGAKMQEVNNDHT